MREKINTVAGKFLRFISMLFSESELHKAVRNKDIRKLKLLLKNGADPDERNITGNTPLHIAISLENIPTVKLLLAHCAQLFIKNRKGKTPYELSREKTSVQDLFENDEETRIQVAVQTLSHELDEAMKKRKF